MQSRPTPLLCELHAHSTWSDGALGIRQLVDLYGRRGVDVLAIPDHAKRDARGVHAANYDAYLSAVEDEAERAWHLYRLLVVPGLELTFDDPDPLASAHAASAGLRSYVDVAAGVETMLRAARARGAALVAAHPYTAEEAETAAP